MIRKHEEDETVRVTKKQKARRLRFCSSICSSVDKLRRESSLSIQEVFFPPLPGKKSMIGQGRAVVHASRLFGFCFKELDFVSSDLLFYTQELWMLSMTRVIPGVISCVGQYIDTERKKAKLLFPRCTCDLGGYITKKKTPWYNDYGGSQSTSTSIQFSEVLDLTKQLLSTLCVLHHMGIVHGDIKYGNILCMMDKANPNQCQFLFSDLGSSRMCRDMQITDYNFTTPYYAAPELLDNKRFVDEKTRAFYICGVTGNKNTTNNNNTINNDNTTTNSNNINSNNNNNNNTSNTDNTATTSNNTTTNSNESSDDNDKKIVFNHKVDIYALGLVLLNFYDGILSDSGAEKYENDIDGMIQYITSRVKGKITNSKTEHENEFFRLLSKMIEPKYELRISSIEALQILENVFSLAETNMPVQVTSICRRFTPSLLSMLPSIYNGIFNPNKSNVEQSVGSTIMTDNDNNQSNLNNFTNDISQKKDADNNHDETQKKDTDNNHDETRKMIDCKINIDTSKRSPERSTMLMLNAAVTPTPAAIYQHDYMRRIKEKVVSDLSTTKKVLFEKKENKPCSSLFIWFNNMIHKILENMENTEAFVLSWFYSDDYDYVSDAITKEEKNNTWLYNNTTSYKQAQIVHDHDTSMMVDNALKQKIYTDVCDWIDEIFTLELKNIAKHTKREMALLAKKLFTMYIHRYTETKNNVQCVACAAICLAVNNMSDFCDIDTFSTIYPHEQLYNKTVDLVLSLF